MGVCFNAKEKTAQKDIVNSMNQVEYLLNRFKLIPLYLKK